jgi:hypothetical protein
MNCMTCKEEIKGDKLLGIHIFNHCIDAMPEEISICKVCAEKLAIEVISGNIFSLLGKLKGIFK